MTRISVRQTAAEVVFFFLALPGYGNLANVLYEQGKYPEAVRRYVQSLSLTEHPEVHVELALTLCELGRFDLAREHYRRAMQIDRSLAPAPVGGLSERGGGEGGTLQQ